MQITWFQAHLPYIIKYVQPLGYMAQTATIWATVLLALNRYVAVCQPFRLADSCSLRTVRAQLIAVFAFAVLFNLPRLFQFDVVRRQGGVNVNANVKISESGGSSNEYGGYSSVTGIDGIFVVTVETTNEAEQQLMYDYVPTSLGERTLFGKIYTNALYSILVLLLPLVILIALNTRIIYEVRRRTVTPLSGSDKTLENNITFVMLVIVFEFLISHMPDRVAQVVKTFIDYEEASCSTLYYLHNICNLLIVLNSSTNFIIYYFFALRFRRILLAKICRRKLGNGRQLQLPAEHALAMIHQHDDHEDVPLKPMIMSRLMPVPDICDRHILLFNNTV